MELVDNVTLRGAVSAFAEAPSADTYGAVLRDCLHGSLLVDATGSDLRMTKDGGSIAKGSKLAFHEGVGLDGRRALFAFTSQEEAQRMHPETPAATIGQSALDLIRFALGQQYAWLYIDPGGTTCGVELADFEASLRSHPNEPIKAALSLDNPLAQKSAVMAALSEGGTLLQAVGELTVGGTTVRTTTGPDRNRMSLAFTSELEIAARYDSYKLVERPVEDILTDAIKPPMSGLVINPAGPWIALDAEQVRHSLELIRLSR